MLFILKGHGDEGGVLYLILSVRFVYCLGSYLLDRNFAVGKFYFHLFLFSFAKAVSNQYGEKKTFFSSKENMLTALATSFCLRSTLLLPKWS